MTVGSMMKMAQGHLRYGGRTFAAGSAECKEHFVSGHRSFLSFAVAMIFTSAIGTVGILFLQN